MKRASPKKRDFVAWAKEHPVPDTSVLAWSGGPSSESLSAARVLLGPAADARVVAVAEHLDALAVLTTETTETTKPRRRAHG